jgi:hypothetical protein
VIGNQVTVSGTVSNDGTYTLTNVAALELTVAEAIADEGPISSTVASDDELATGNGYTQDTKTTGVVTLTEDDSNDRAEATYPTVTWNASGGSIGPTPGAILYDDTSTDNVIIQYIDFDGEQTATDGNPFSISGGKIRCA